MKYLPPTVRYEDFLKRSLRDPEECAAYLNASLEEKGRLFFLRALRDVFDAQGGMTKIAKQAKLNRVSLYKMLRPDGNPSLDSILRLLNVIGIRLHVTAIPVQGGHRPAKQKLLRKAA